MYAETRYGTTWEASTIVREPDAYGRRAATIREQDKSIVSMSQLSPCLHIVFYGANPDFIALFCLHSSSSNRVLPEDSISCGKRPGF